MKQFILILLLGLTGLSMAQQFTGGLKAGLAVSQIAGDGFSGFNKAGFYGGAYLQFHLNPNVSLQMDLAYIQKGSAQHAEPETGVPQYLLQLDYVELPLVFQYHLLPLTFEAGISFDFLAVQNEEINYQLNDQGDVWRGMNLASVFGIQYHFTERWAASLRTVNSVQSIRKNSVPLNVRRYGRNYGAFNDVLTFGICYKL